jgi:Dna[CI] antecedent, DciA
MRRRKKPAGGLVEVGQLLEGALKALGAKGDFEKFQVERKCRELLGVKSSRALKEVSLRGRTVRMAFDHSIWLNEVGFHRDEILKALQREFPGIGIQQLDLTLWRQSRP